MRTKEELIRIAQDALRYCKSQPDVKEVEVFVACSGAKVARYSYTSAILCNALEEPKGTNSEGIGLLVLFQGENGIEVGFGSEEGSLNAEGVIRALDKARKGKHHDPEFYSLPRPSGEVRTLWDYHDPEMMDLSPGIFVDASYRILDGAIEAALSSPKLSALCGGYKFLRNARLIVGGDLTLLQERVALCSSVMPEVQTDESTLAMAFITAMVEEFDPKGAKGSGYGTWTKLSQVDEAPGKSAVQNAIASIHGERVPSGKYTVVFGPAAMADLVGLVLSSLSLDSFYARDSMFCGKLGERVTSERVDLYDDGNSPGLVASKGITCEGLPTGRTQLIKDGVLVGMLCSWYETERILRDPEARNKLGKDPKEWRQAIVPRNGFRFTARGGGRIPSSQAHPFGTNVVLSSSSAIPFEELIGRVKDGLLVGRIWYAYPMGSKKQAEITATVVADSFLIRNGRVVEGLAINSLRLNDNLARIINNVEAMSLERATPLIWAADSVRHMPLGTLVTDVLLDAIAEDVLIDSGV